MDEIMSCEDNERLIAITLEQGKNTVALNHSHSGSAALQYSLSIENVFYASV
jgi:hypothetical protein